MIILILVYVSALFIASMDKTLLRAPIPLQIKMETEKEMAEYLKSQKEEKLKEGGKTMIKTVQSKSKYATTTTATTSTTTPEEPRA